MAMGRVCHRDAHHWYSSAPEWAQQELVVEIGAFTVVPYTPEGMLITTHARQYGDTRTDTIDPRTREGVSASLGGCDRAPRG